MRGFRSVGRESEKKREGEKKNDRALVLPAGFLSFAHFARCRVHMCRRLSQLCAREIVGQ